LGSGVGTPNGLPPEARRVKNGVFLGRSSQPPFPHARGLGSAVSSPSEVRRAATNILTKIRKFRDIRAGQKGPKSDQKGT